MTDLMWGWVVIIEPGMDPEDRGYADVKWNLFETKPEGINSIMGQIDPAWETTTFTYGFADDMRDHAGLDGLVAFVRTNMPPTEHPLMPVRFGREQVAADFIVCGLLDGMAIPLHSREQSEEVIQWLLTKQGTWYAQYERPDYIEPPKTIAPAFDPSTGPAQRGQRKTIH